MTLYEVNIKKKSSFCAWKERRWKCPIGYLRIRCQNIINKNISNLNELICAAYLQLIIKL